MDESERYYNYAPDVKSSFDEFKAKCEGEGHRFTESTYDERSKVMANLIALAFRDENGTTLSSWRSGAQ